ncbi:hypothetical protein LOOC260_107560 [Paucilactobacillus hokkaidonensis JCM 18461]|uniref:Bacteriocin n=2 Tax=Paucilactobacillus hokkaidonensis TaxID=1193095 RepID=A0A0A1GXV6_9LACO|nr:hypothetical protein [Paucilactobacillus hokkaidonensis]KRO09293.1 hypothetical protein IV59_GL000746 [Paucilactobacillus hokkaidonensis]BAP85296.1 hypothetical protein LOOC260_107560 [Paucilactobacillus hokkaidonensis JCM 18461]
MKSMNFVQVSKYFREFNDDEKNLIQGGSFVGELWKGYGVGVSKSMKFAWKSGYNTNPH